MKPHICRWALTLLIFGSASLYAQEVYRQDPIAFGNPSEGFTGLSSVLPAVGGGVESISRGYDNFTLDSEVQITGLEWKGSYNGPFNPNELFRSIADFSIEFFSSTATNAPDTSNPVASFELNGGTAGNNDGTDLTSIVAPNQLSSGIGGGGEGQPASPGIVETYNAPLEGFVLQPGTYWLAIQAIQDFPSPFPPQNPDDPNRWFDPSWSWALGDGEVGDGQLFSFDTLFGDRVDADGTIGPGIPLDSDLAFTVLGEPVEQGPPQGPSGDLNLDGELDVLDVDLLRTGITTCRRNCANFDLNSDGIADENDLDFWITDIRRTLPGDADLNGTVQFPDFLALSRNFTQEGGWAEGNFTIDDVVSFPDFLVLSRNFGLTAAEFEASGEAATVPEPTAAMLLLGGMLFAGVFRRRRVGG